MKITRTILTTLALMLATQSLFAAVVINEFLADPPLGLLGDTNKDGIRSASDDEFIEIFNTGIAAIDISKWSLWDAAERRHLFSDNISLAKNGRLVVFGGGNLGNFLFPAITASTGRLSLNNTSDTIYLKNSIGEIVDFIVYGADADKDQSLVRSPEGSGPFTGHLLVSSVGHAFSPGTVTNPLVNEAASSPEPSTLAILSFGLVLLALAKKARIKANHHQCVKGKSGFFTL